MKRITDNYAKSCFMSSGLRDEVLELEDKFEEACKLLQVAHDFSIAVPGTNALPYDELIYQKTRWEAVRKQIHDFLFPPPPVFINMSFDSETFKLKIWLNKSIETVDLVPGEDFYIGARGTVRLTGTFEELWKRRAKKDSA